MSSETLDCEALQVLITAERLTSYMSACGQDLTAAIDLYDWNTRASAAVLATTAMVEIVVRNAIDRTLTEWATLKHPGQDWLDCAPLDQRGIEDVQKARVRAATATSGSSSPRGKIIAELNFGFWRYLAASRYLTSLWIPAVHNAFPAGPQNVRARQREVERRLRDLLLVRNRAAHHEPIHRRDLAQDFRRAHEVAGWVHPEAARWIGARSLLPAIANERTALRRSSRAVTPAGDN